MWHAVQNTQHKGRKMTAEYVRNQHKEKPQVQKSSMTQDRLMLHIFLSTFVCYITTWFTNRL